MAELSFDIFAIACGNSAPAPAPAPEHGEREPELPEHFLVRHLGLKRPAEASPPVSPEKPRAAERVVSDDELDPEDDDAPAPADVDERTRFAKPMGSDRERWEARLNESVVDDQILQGCSPKCGCVFAHGLVLKDQVLANRAQFAGMSETERRQWLRSYLGATGGDLLWGHVAKRACVKGFSVFTGFTPAFIYARLKDHENGIVADDPNLGGARVKGLVGGGDDSSDSPTVMAVHGWFQGKILEIEPAPNTHIHEIDFMEKEELYKEFHDDMTSTGTVDVASYDTWYSVWKKFYGNVRIREYRSVDSKDKVRAELRQLLRRSVSKAKSARDYYRALRKQYRESMRRERAFYWEYRVRPATDPLVYLSYIQDGASQEVYHIPKFPNTESGRDGVQFKLVGNLWHGHALVLHVVHPHVADDANLFCHCLHTALDELVKVRVQKGEPAHLPPHLRIQIDGVSTNWGKTSLAFIEDLARRGVVDNSTAARNPVGNTHEDIDAIFKLIKAKLDNLTMLTREDLSAGIMSAFPGGVFGEKRLPVVICPVDVTLDYIRYYADCIDPTLANFSYSEHQKGYHVFHAQRGATSSTTCAFKKYQQDNFLTVAVSPDDLLQMPADDRERYRAMQPVEWHPHEIIIRNSCVARRGV